MDYQISPIPDNEAERIAALQSAMCAYVPREDRFDRITRMAQRMLHVPIVLISIIEDDVQWFRSSSQSAGPAAFYAGLWTTGSAALFGCLSGR